MGLNYYIDGTLPEAAAGDLVTLFERLIERCPSDAMLSFSLLSVGGRLCLEVSMISANMRFRESLESGSIQCMKRALKKMFKSRIEGWRIKQGEV